MSLPSKITLGLSCAASIGVIFYVHHKQQEDRWKLHQGVIMDIQRQQMRKIENIYRLQQQDDLTHQLKSIEINKDNSNPT